MTRMHIDTSIFGCTGISVARHYPDLNRAIALKVKTESGGSFELMMYGLPQKDVDFLLQLKDEETHLPQGAPGPDDVAAGEALNHVMSEREGDEALDRELERDIALHELEILDVDPAQGMDRAIERARQDPQ